MHAGEWLCVVQGYSWAESSWSAVGLGWLYYGLAREGLVGVEFWGRMSRSGERKRREKGGKGERKKKKRKKKNVRERKISLS